MTEKEKLNPGLTLESVIKLINRHVPQKNNGSDNSTTLRAIKTGRREHAQPPVSDLRMVVRIQRKNKHPHSTKKHK